MNLQPLGDRLIVEVLDEEELTVSGIVRPDTAREKPQRGRVLAVGPGGRDEDGKYIEMDVAEGDEVVFSKYGGTEIKLGIEDVLILRESDVLAKVVTTGSARIFSDRRVLAANRTALVRALPAPGMPRDANSVNLEVPAKSENAACRGEGRPTVADLHEYL